MWVVVEMRWTYDDIDYMNIMGPYDTYEEAQTQAQSLRDNDSLRLTSPSLSYSVKPLIMPREINK
jgi:hypothetical protein